MILHFCQMLIHKTPHVCTIEQRRKRHHFMSSLLILFVTYIYIALVFLGLTLYLAEGRSRQTLSWTQRIAAAIGVAKGIEFLHTGILPGVYSNNLKITDILLDQNLVAKISSYNLPLLAENMGKV